MRGRARATAFIMTLALALTAAGGAVSPPPALAAEPAFWDRIAQPQREKADRLVQRAKDLLAEGTSPGDARHPQPADSLARAEVMLRQALLLDTPEFSTLFLLAEVQSLRGHAVDAAATLARAEPLARLPAQKAACWFRLGIERSKLGRYREAVASYDLQIGLGEAESAVYANAAELLMTLGRLEESEDRYREAIRIDERAGDRRGHEQSLAFSYYGLGVALDRDHQETPSREAIGRALALDPNTSMLRLAQQPGTDIFFIPEGDVFYYLGLASEVGGHRDDAMAAFQEYMSRQPDSAWVARARAHLAALAPPRAIAGATAGGAATATPSSSPVSPPPPRSPWRVVAVATVQANGPIPAPLIDAALKQRPPAWEECLAPFPPPRGHEPVRLVLELELDANGTVSRAVAKLPAALATGGAGPCLEAALRARLVVARPTHAKPTSARVEVLLANGDAGGL